MCSTPADLRLVRSEELEVHERAHDIGRERHHKREAERVPLLHRHAPTDHAAVLASSRMVIRRRSMQRVLVRVVCGTGQSLARTWRVHVRQGMRRGSARA